MKKDNFTDIKSVIKKHEQRNTVTAVPQPVDRSVNQQFQKDIITLTSFGITMKIKDHNNVLIGRYSQRPEYNFTRFISRNEGQSSFIFEAREIDGDKYRVIKFVKSPRTNIANINEISTLLKLSNTAGVCAMEKYGFCDLSVNRENMHPYYYIIMHKYPSTNIRQYYKVLFSETTGNLETKLRLAKHFTTLPPECRHYIDDAERTSAPEALVNPREDHQQELMDLNYSKQDFLMLEYHEITKATLDRFMEKFTDLLDNFDIIHNTKRIVHGDIKTDNILADIDPRAGQTFTVIDWGSSVENSHTVSAIRSSNKHTPIESGYRYPASRDLKSLCRMLAKIINPDLEAVKADSPDEIRRIKYGLWHAGAYKHITKAICDTLNGKIKTAKALSKRLRGNKVKHILYKFFSSISSNLYIQMGIFLVVIAGILIMYFSGFFSSSKPTDTDNSNHDSSISENDQEYDSNVINPYFASHKWKDETLKNEILNTYDNEEYIGYKFSSVQTLLINVNKGTEKTVIEFADDALDNSITFYSNATSDPNNKGEQYKYFAPYDNDEGKLLLNEQHPEYTFTSLDDIKELFPNLSTIAIANCNIPESFDAFNEMNYLNTVILYNCNVTELSSFRNVEKILINNRGNNGAKTRLSADEISDLKNIQALSLHGFEVDLTGLGRLKGLRTLNLRECDFDYAVLSNECGRLNNLYLDNATADELNALGGNYNGALYIAFSDFRDHTEELSRFLSGRSGYIYFFACDFASADAVEELGKNYNGKIVFHQVFENGSSSVIKLKDTDGQTVTKFYYQDGELHI